VRAVAGTATPSTRSRRSTLGSFFVEYLVDVLLASLCPDAFIYLRATASLGPIATVGSGPASRWLLCWLDSA